MTLSEALYSSNAKAALVAGSFAVETSGASVAPTGISGTGPYVLTFAAATTPNTSKVVLASSFTSTGTAVGRMDAVVPLTGSDAARTVAALATVEVDGKPFAPLPFVGSWMASLQPKPSSGGGAALRAAAGATFIGPPTGLQGASAQVTAASDSDDEDTADRESEELELASTPLRLTDMISGLPAALAKTATMTTQAAITAELEAVPGIETVTFTATGATVVFAAGENAGTKSSDQRTEVAGLRYALDGPTSFALHLAGDLDLTLPSGGAAAYLADLDLQMRPRSLSLPATQTVGMVAVGTDAQAVTSDLSLSVDCLDARCAATPTVAITGGVALEVNEVRFTDGGGVTKVDVRDGGPATATWTPALWKLRELADLTDDTSAEAKLLTAALRPAVTHATAWSGKGLLQLDQLDSHAVTLGLEWVGNWLRSTDAVEALGTQLPAVGLSVGDVLQLSCWPSTCPPVRPVTRCWPTDTCGWVTPTAAGRSAAPATPVSRSTTWWSGWSPAPPTPTSPPSWAGWVSATSGSPGPTRQPCPGSTTPPGWARRAVPSAAPSGS